MLAACGGVTRDDEDAADAADGTSGPPQTGGVGAGTTTGGGAAGSGASGGAGTSSSGVGGFGGGACSAFDHVTCLANHPQCAPVYDDLCCPSCEPTGGCADCVDMQFAYCSDWEPACGDTLGLLCGTPTEAGCAGTPAQCGAAEGSPSPCGAWPGCIATYCAADADCKTEPLCSPATAGTCTALCAVLPPPCPPGLVPEADGGCWTGMCIDDALCAVVVDN
jgi:hypothetical protein